MRIDRNSDDYLKSRFKQSYGGDDSYTKVEKELFVKANNEANENWNAGWIRMRTMP